jgi:hypothetical protein
MEEDYMGSQGAKCTLVLEDKEGRSRKRGRRGKGGRGRRGIRRNKRKKKKNKNENNAKKNTLLLRAIYTSSLNTLSVLIQTIRTKKQ